MFILVGPVPLITVTFDSQPRIKAIDDQIDSLPDYLYLGAHCVLPSKKFQGNIDFEPAIKWFWLVTHTSCAPGIPFQAIKIFSTSFQCFMPCAFEEVNKPSP
jgi:hypothetical protein